ncbi:ABC transporter substrate-binding protein [Methanohalophilus sp.]
MTISFSMTGCAIATENTQYPLEVTDNLGENITIASQPTRIVSTMPSNTEQLFAIGAGENVVGGTIHDTYPPEAAEIEKVGGYANLDLEKIIDLNPDLVIAGEGNGEENIDMMRNEFGMNVIVLKPENVSDIIENIELLGSVTNKSAEAISVTSDMRKDIDKIESVTEDFSDSARPRVLYIVWDDPMYAAGTNTFPSDLIYMAGGQNILESEGWPVVDVEAMMEKDPEVIICSSMGAEDKSVSEELADNIRDNELLAYTSALQNDRVYPISNPKLVEIPGPRIVQGLDEIHTILQPLSEEKLKSSDQNSTEISNPTEDVKDSKETQQSPGLGILLSSIVLIILYSSITLKRK